MGDVGMARKRKECEISAEELTNGEFKGMLSESGGEVEEVEQRRDVKYHKIVWTEEENTRLIDLVVAFGDEPVQWHEIAKHFNGRRSAKRCRERWVEYSDPALSTEPFTVREDQLLLHLQQCYGNRWKKISSLLYPCNRSPTAIKARWNRLQRDGATINASMINERLPYHVVPVRSYGEYVMSTLPHSPGPWQVQQQCIHWATAPAPHPMQMWPMPPSTSSATVWLHDRYFPHLPHSNITTVYSNMDIWPESLLPQQHRVE